MTTGISPKDPNTAFLIEFVGGFFGLLGLGYFYAGRTNDGVIRLIAWLVYTVIAVVAIHIAARGHRRLCVHPHPTRDPGRGAPVVGQQIEAGDAGQHTGRVTQLPATAPPCGMGDRPVLRAYRRYVPINSPCARTCPAMAASSCALFAPAARSSTVSSAYTRKK